MIHVLGGGKKVATKKNTTEAVTTVEEVKATVEEIKEQKIKRLEPEPEVKAKIGMVTGGKLNLRKNGAAGADIITVLNDGDIVTTTDNTNKAWINVKTNVGTSGYVMSKFVTFK